MLKASSLTYGIMISLLVVLMSGSLLLVDELKRSFIRDRSEEEKAIRDVRSGFELLLSSRTVLPPDTEKEHALYGEGEGTVALERRSWGLLEVFRSSKRIGGAAISKMGMVGRELTADKGLALYLPDRSDVLTVSGSTRLRGECAVPGGRVERGYIEGKSYSGDQLVYGEVGESERELPAIQQELIGPIEERLDGKLREKDSLVSLELIEEKGSLEASFAERTRVIDHRGPSLDLSGFTLKGNVIVLSQGEVKVGAESKLEDILILAERILIEKGFEGDLQGFARTRIDVGEDAVLDYPSALGVIGGTEKKDTSVMELAQGAELTGFLFYTPRNEGSVMGQGRVDLMKESVVEGQLYIDGLVQPRGSIEGSLYCKGIFLGTPSSTYREHLLDAVIDVRARSEHFVGAGLVRTSEKKALIERL